MKNKSGLIRYILATIWLFIMIPVTVQMYKAKDVDGNNLIFIHYIIITLVCGALLVVPIILLIPELKKYVVSKSKTINNLIHNSSSAERFDKRKKSDISSQDVFQDESSNLSTKEEEKITRVTDEFIARSKAKLKKYTDISSELIEKKTRFDMDIIDYIEHNAINSIMCEMGNFDPMLQDAVKCVIEVGQASTSLLQRRLRVGYARSGRLIDKMEQMGVVGPHEGDKPRQILITYQQFLEMNFSEYDKKNYKQETQNVEERAYEFEEYDGVTGYTANIDLIKGTFIERIDESTYEKMIEIFIKNSDPKELRALVINIGYMKLPYEYNSVVFPLLVPIITNLRKAKSSLYWIEKEMEHRYSLLIKKGKKNVEGYNLESEKNKIPKILVTIDDYSIFKNTESLKEANETLQKILIQGERVEIYIVVGSKFRVEDSGIGSISKYLKVVSDRDFNNTINIENDSLDNELSGENFIDKIDIISGYEFENYSKKLLIGNGFTDVEITKRSGDQGADLVAYKEGIKYAIQCKKYSKPVGNYAVQEVIGSKNMYDCHVAVVMTNNYFTKSAKELAAKSKVLLWDRGVIIDLLSKST